MAEAGGRREKGKSGLIHAYLAFTSPSNAIDIQSKRPCGAKECDKCIGVCSGHYLGTEDLLVVDNCNLSKAHTSPPSTVIKDAFDNKQKQGLEMTPL